MLAPSRHLLEEESFRTSAGLVAEPVIHAHLSSLPELKCAHKTNGLTRCEVFRAKGSLGFASKHQDTSVASPPLQLTSAIDKDLPGHTYLWKPGILAIQSDPKCVN